jgi:hypothetical protein
MSAIKAKLVFPLSLRERPDPDPRSASGSWPSHRCVTMEIDWMTPEEPNEATRPIGSAFIAKACLRQRARAA